MGLELLALPAFTDNYIWMLHDGSEALVVDPGESVPVLAALKRLKLGLAGILVTHHHGDHVGGLAPLMELLQGQVWGPARESIPAPPDRYRALHEGETLTLLGQTLQVIEVPGHTAGHLAFYASPPDQAPLLFCGDTLFSGGCGRLFEGTAVQMWTSLQRLAALPGNTRVCCAHEYTLSNLRFARTIEPGNQALAAYQAWCEARREQELPTLPSSIGQELDINPFLRCDQAAVRAAVLARSPESLTAQQAEPAAVFALLRQWKNEFR
ncbi:hydroxyacylglutathione hydrolase [Roseateles asaccharophilus]|uniref:Hydroxyacylglutathione hydrolase n=1 Tax=Roseateles asaccharophilus TaxID=582607 RepID=A0A4R6N8B6_9BURK|nr:hydroxyacylglutathione hydrolase [Roseateles asaccharophilus]